MAFETWYLFRTPGQRAVKDLTQQDVLDRLALFALCGAALMSFVTSCFLKIPVLENACSLHSKEGFIVTLHYLAFALAAVLLILTVLRQSRPGRLVPLGLLTIAVALVVATMEEISWGQTFLGWQTSETVASWNYQNETNLHNAFNFVMGRTYLALGIIGFLVISTSILIRRAIPHHPLTIMLPTTPMFRGGLWLPPASRSGFYTDTEPFESILAILAVYYAVRLWRDASSGTSS
jgi:hypothetical protein